MMNFNERTNSLLYKNISLTLYSQKGWCSVVCERWVGDGDRLLHIDPSSSDHSSTSSSSWLGLLNCGSLRAQSLLSAAGSHAGILSPTGSNSNWLYFCLTPTCFRCSSTYLQCYIYVTMCPSKHVKIRGSTIFFCAVFKK